MKKTHFGALIALFLAPILFTAFEVTSLSKAIRIGQPPIVWTGEILMTPDYTTSWQSSRGTETVNTTCTESETPRECLDRHNAKVTLAQEDNPPLP